MRSSAYEFPRNSALRAFLQELIAFKREKGAGGAKRVYK